MNLMIANVPAFQWRVQAQNEVFTAFSFRFYAGGFASGVCRGKSDKLLRRATVGFPVLTGRGACSN
jgi:hypothetical protein